MPPRPQAPPAQRDNKTIIGQGIVFTGEITGNGDLEVRGEVNGTIALPNSIAHVDKSGVAKATINAREVDILGRVEGDISATEVIRMRKDSTVAGNVSAPQVSLEAGALFKGSVDMKNSAKAAPPEAERRPATPPPQNRPAAPRPQQGSLAAQNEPQVNPASRS